MCGWQVTLCDPLVTHGPYPRALAVVLPIIRRYINMQITLTLTLSDCFILQLTTPYKKITQTMVLIIFIFERKEKSKESELYSALQCPISKALRYGPCVYPSSTTAFCQRLLRKRSMADSPNTSRDTACSQFTSQHTAHFIRRRQLLSAYTMTYRRG